MNGFDVDAALATQLNEESPLRAAILTGERKPPPAEESPSLPPLVIELGDGREVPQKPRPEAPPHPNPAPARPPIGNQAETE